MAHWVYSTRRTRGTVPKDRGAHAQDVLGKIRQGGGDVFSGAWARLKASDLGSCGLIR